MQNSDCVVVSPRILWGLRSLAPRILWVFFLVLAWVFLAGLGYLVVFVLCASAV